MFANEEEYGERKQARTKKSHVSFFFGFVGTSIGKAKTDGSGRLCASADNLTLQRRFPAPASRFPVF